MDSYTANGVANDHEWVVNHRDLLESAIRDEMKVIGLAPALDIPMEFMWEYTQDMMCRYRVQAKGLRVGQKQAMKSMGYMSKEGFLVSADAEEVSVLV